MESLRTRIETGFESFGRTIFRNRLKTLALMSVLIAGFLSQLPRITFDASNEAFFHKAGNILEEYDAFRAQFGREEVIIIGISPPNVFDRIFLEKLARFHEALENEVPFVEEITSLVNVRHTRGKGDELIVEDLLKKIPRTPQGMAELRTRVLGSTLYPNYLISEDGKFTTIVIEPVAHAGSEAEGPLEAGFDEDKISAGDVGGDGTGSVAGGSSDPIFLTTEQKTAMDAAVRKVGARFEGPDFPLVFAGAPLLDVFFDAAMQSDMGTFTGLAVLAIAIFLLVLFRRIAGMVLPLLVVILSLLSTIGLMAATGVPITIPTTILPSFLLAVGVGASVHLLAIFFRDFQRHGDRERGIAFALGHSGLPIVMTSVTTAAGLFAFMTSQLAPVAHLGIFGGLGALIALVYTMVLIPALLAVWPLRQHARIASRSYGIYFDRMLNWVADFSVRRAWPIVIVSVLLVVVSFVGLTQLRFSSNFLDYIPKSLPIRQAVDQIDEKMKGSMSLEVVVNTGAENGLYEPHVMNGIEGLAEFATAYRNAQGRHLIGKTNSVVNVLKETHKALNENRPEFYTVPQNRQLIAQELLLFENSGSDDLENLVDPQFSLARLSLRAPFDDAAVYVNFVDELKAEARRRFGDGGVTVTGTMNMWTQMIDNMMRSMAQSYLIAFGVISILMMVLVGSIRIGVLAMVVNLSPILVTMGLIMGFADIPLDASTLLIGSIALGLAVDDTIHFFHNFRRYYGKTQDVGQAVRETLTGSGRAMLFTTMVL
ncbi:MAG: MMPL family transporter, partial [SAR324 cluster bacterium]|nr:MMPL family transporter [SAR324 cluster bacterium]